VEENGMIKFPSTTRLVVAVATAALLATSCASTEHPLDIGFRRIALDLSFKDAEKASPVEPQVVIRQFLDADTQFSILPAREEPTPADPTIVRQVRIIPRRVQRECPTAPEGATPEFPAFAVVKDPPKPGTYHRHNEGKLNVTLAGSGFDIPVPALSKWDIPKVETVRSNKSLSDEDKDTLNVPDAVESNDTAFIEMPQFELTRRLLPGYSVTDTYRYTYTEETGGDFLFLVKRVTVARGVESVFTPSPPIRVLRLNATEGDITEAGTTHGGIDRSTNVAMTIESQILHRELVDVCGEIVDTYRVQVKERVVDLSGDSPDVSGNEGDTANFWNIQFDNGLLIVREEVHSTLRTTGEYLGQPVPIQVKYDYVSTLDSTTPAPLESPGKTPTAGAAEGGE
jgi:hypothetical protein